MAAVGLVLMARAGSLPVAREGSVTMDRVGLVTKANRVEPIPVAGTGWVPMAGRGQCQWLDWDWS